MLDAHTGQDNPGTEMENQNKTKKKYRIDQNFNVTHDFQTRIERPKEVEAYEQQTYNNDQLAVQQ